METNQVRVQLLLIHQCDHVTQATTRDDLVLTSRFL